MERERWIRLYALAIELSRGWRYGCKFNAAVVLGVYFWAVVHDRPVSWACQQRNWPADLCARGLPSQSTMSRRLRSVPVIRLLHLIELQFQANSDVDGAKFIDAKPLTVSGVSKDPEVGWGRAAGAFGKGYKLYVIWGRGCFPIAYQVAAINVSEKQVARHLIPELRGRGYLVGDAIYDVAALYDLAAVANHQLVVERRRTSGLGRGHRPQSPHRLKGIALLGSADGRRLLRERVAIERSFGHCTSFGGGLGPLPNWVRRLQRVRLWVQAKLFINALRILDLPRKLTPALA
jgi:hypothetical protein